MPVNIVILSPIWEDAVAELRRNHGVVLAGNAGVTPLSSALPRAEVVVLRSGVRLDASALALAGRLRLAVRAGTGLEGIDLEAARSRGVRVVCVPLSARSVAEHTLALLLALAHRVVQQDRNLRQGRWGKHDGLGRDLGGLLLGLLGFGRIGIHTAELALAFGMRVQAHDRSPDKPHKREAADRLGVGFVDLRCLLETSDALAIQAPLDDTTRGLLGAREIGRMKPDALLVNVGRGGILDETALAEALGAGRLGGAALDVFDREPPGASPLLGLDTFVGTPHIAAQTVGAQRHIGAMVVRLVEAFATGADLTPFGVEM